MAIVSKLIAKHDRQANPTSIRVVVRRNLTQAVATHAHGASKTTHPFSSRRGSSAALCGLKIEILDAFEDKSWVQCMFTRLEPCDRPEQFSAWKRICACHLQRGSRIWILAIRGRACPLRKAGVQSKNNPKNNLQLRGVYYTASRWPKRTCQKSGTMATQIL